MGKKNKRKKIDIRKKRKKIVKEKQKQPQKQEVVQIKKEKTTKEKALDLRLKRETKLYWIRGATGALSALIGRLFFGFIGWILLFWMLVFWFLFPFFVSFVILRYKYDKEEWTWKNIIKPGLGVFFFLFMIIGIFIHTMLQFF